MFEVRSREFVWKDGEAVHVRKSFLDMDMLKTEMYIKWKVIGTRKRIHISRHNPTYLVQQC